MTDRVDVERIIRELHAARVAGDLEGICRLFADDGAFQIAGASDGKPIAITAANLRDFRPWLTMMVKAFRLQEYTLLSLIVDGDKAAAHWRVRIDSKITGKSVSTELVDLAEVRGGMIARYTEFFVPR